MTAVEMAVDSGTTERAAAARAQERRLNLLREIALAGGKTIPAADPSAEHGYSYAALGNNVTPDLSTLAKQHCLEARFFDRVTLCPKCNSHHVNVREVCPGCRRAHVTKDGLLHHFRCGYVGIPSEFSPAVDGSYTCPKCRGRMHHLGTEYDRLGRAFVCRACGLISENPPAEAVCLACSARTPAEDLLSAVVFSYVLTSRGAEAIRRGSLIDGDEEQVCASDAPVYSRSVMLEFLDHEVKRLQHLNNRFCVLLGHYAAATTDRDGDHLPAHWLTRLRCCLREVDVIGQMADSLYVVLLPQTRRREAEAMRRRIATELGPQSPITLSAAEISEPRQLAQLVGGLMNKDEPS